MCFEVALVCQVKLVVVFGVGGFGPPWWWGGGNVVWDFQHCDFEEVCEELYAVAPRVVACGGSLGSAFGMTEVVGVSMPAFRPRGSDGFEAIGLVPMDGPRGHGMRLAVHMVP